jgi:lactoylglutathione lyase
MKTLHPAYRVSDLARSMDFYQTVGFQEIGRVEIAGGVTLVMLNLPGDGDVVTLELVYDLNQPLDVGNGFSHLAVQVDDIAATLSRLAEGRVAFSEPDLHGDDEGVKTSFLYDPDGYRIELVQWPAGHSDAMTRADFL